MDPIQAVEMSRRIGPIEEDSVRQASNHSIDALQQRFSELLSRAAPVEHMPAVGESNVISDFVKEQEDLFQGMDTHAKDFALNSYRDTPQQAAARLVEMINETSKMNCMMQGSVALTKSIKSNVQTLVKNQ